MADVYRFRDWYIPDRMMAGLQRYINDHVPVGDFLTAVLRNDLMEAVNRADEENMANLPAYVGYLYNEAPSSCFGSPERVRKWLEAGQKEREEKDGQG
jgi:hypothetical protein